MVGGTPEHVATAQPLFDALKPAEGGFVHAGPVGTGHFTKMVHNGIEYGLMQAYAEGYELLARSGLGIDVDGRARRLAHGLGRAVVAARPAGAGPAADPRPRRHPRVRQGLGRGPLDRAGGDRARRRHPGHQRRAVRPVRVAAGRLGRHEGHRRPAQPVRRPRRAARDRGGRPRRAGARAGAGRMVVADVARRRPATRWCCSAPPATWRARRSSRPSTRWSATAGRGMPVIGVSSSD